MIQMSFQLDSRGEKTPLDIQFERVFAIGYAGRDMAKTMEHIRELEEQLGVAPPQQIPTIFQCSDYTLTQGQSLEVVGNQTCGEVEYVIVTQGQATYIGLGSDHTDRALEAVSVLKSKQICPKPIAPVLWKLDEIIDHWDQIELHSQQVVDGQQVDYQRGTLADILPSEKILQELHERIGPTDRDVIFSGTVPLLEGFVYGERFLAQMIDPVLERSIELDYQLRVIPEGER